MELNKLLLNNTTFIVGSDKNSGKTTFLNYALRQLRGITPLAFLTIGIDGEKQDLISGNPKPCIYSIIGDYLVTTELMLNKTDILFEIHEVFPIKTVLGRLVLVRTLRDGFIELVGPEDNTQLANILSFIRFEKKIKTVLVDGAINRITQVSAFKKAGFIYVLKVMRSNLGSALEKIKTLSLLKDIPQADEKNIENSGSFVFKGALTSSKLNQIPPQFNNLILEDFTRIFLKYSELKALNKKRKIFFSEAFNFHFFLINLYDVKKDDFTALLAQNNLSVKVVFNPYQF